MIGFTADAITTSITFYDNELEDAKWFSKDEIIEKVRRDELRLSTEFSISFRLIEDWFNSSGGISLSELLHSL